MARKTKLELKPKRALKLRSKPKAKAKPFRLEEATIAELHQAIRAGRTTLVDVVQGYLARVRAYNGVASVGYLPTFNGKQILLEVFIFNFIV